MNSTFYYAKLFLLMVIPVYGFFFTALLAFSKDVEVELKNLARGALIARVTFLVVLGIFVSIFISAILPYLGEFINNIGIFRMFL